MATENTTRKLGRFDIFEKVGEGGFGTVYRGYDPMWDKPVAIKVLHKDISRLPNAVERFRKEAKVAAELRHPNIVGVSEVGEHEADYYLVMDYISGGTLAQRMQQTPTFSLSEVVNWLHPIAEALDYAHSRKKIIHRDIKPSNILIGEDGQVYLTDFGLIKLTEDASNTSTGAILGTYEYMAPEQITGKELTPATDLYALGVIAFQMLTGKTPFASATNSPFEIQEGHVHHAPPDPRTLRPEIPEEASRVLLKALAKDPSQRYASGREFIGAFQATVENFKGEKITQLKQLAGQAAQKFNFSSAIAALQEIESISPSLETQRAISDYQQKTALLTEYQHKAKEARTASEQLAVVKTKIPWYTGEEPQIVPAEEKRSLSTGKADWFEFLAILAVVVAFQGANSWVDFPGTFWYPVGILVIFAAFSSTLIKPYWWVVTGIVAAGLLMAMTGWQSYQYFYTAANLTYVGAGVQPLLFIAAILIIFFRARRLKKKG